MKFISSLYVILAAMCWGSSGLFVHILTDLGFNSLQCTSIRVCGAALMMIVFVLIKNPKLFKVKVKDLPLLFCNGFLGIFMMSLLYFVSISSGTAMSIAAILIYTAPFMVIIYSCFFMGEKMTVKKVVSLIVAFAGCCIVSLSEPGYSTPKGIIFGLMSGVMYATYSLFGAVLLKKYHPYTVTVYSLIFASIGGIAVAVVTDIGKVFAQSTDIVSMILPVVGTGFVTAMIPFVLYTKGLAKITPATASIMAYIEPVTASVLGYFIGEKLTVPMFFGIFLVIFAVVFLNTKMFEKKQ